MRSCTSLEHLTLRKACRENHLGRRKAGFVYKIESSDEGLDEAGMEVGVRPRSKAMVSTTKPTKGRKLDAILLKISETSKSDIGDEKHGISPENLSVQMLGETGLENMDSIEFEEHSSLDESFDSIKRRKTTRKGDVRRLMRPSEMDSEQLEESTLNVQDGDDDSMDKIVYQSQSPAKLSGINGHRDDYLEENLHNDDSPGSPSQEIGGEMVNSAGGLNTIGERLSLLDAYLYHEGSDEDEGQHKGRKDMMSEIQDEVSFDSDNFVMDDEESGLLENGAVTVVPVEPEPMDPAKENRSMKTEKGKGSVQPPTCNICGKSFSCISNVYRHKRKVHRKKGSRVTSNGNFVAPPPVTHALKTVESPQTEEKNSDKVSPPITSNQTPSHHLGREINCELCGKTLTKSNIARHRRLVHFNPNRRQPVPKPVVKEEKKEIKAPTEGKEVAGSKGRKEIKDLIKRETSNAPKLSTLIVGKKIKFSCDICRQVFSCRSNVYRHKRLVHKRSSKDGAHIGKSSVVSSVQKSFDKPIKRDAEGEKKRDVKKEKTGKEKNEGETGNAELSFPLDTPANSMVSLPSYRRSKYVCNVCGLVFMARSTYYRHKKTHRTAAENEANANKVAAVESVKSEVTTPSSEKNSQEKSQSEAPKGIGNEEKKKLLDETSTDNVRAAAVSGASLTVITSGRGKSKFACGICGQVFPCRSNAYHHRRLAHGKFGHSIKEDKENVAVDESVESQTPDNLRWSRRPGSCDICGKIFSCKGNIYRHKRLVHGVDGGRAMFQDESPKEQPVSPPVQSPPSDKNDSGKYLCDICGNGFSCSGNVQRHKRNVHGMTPTREAYMSNSRAKQILAKAKSYSTRRAAALGHSHDLRSSGVPFRSGGHKKQGFEKRRTLNRDGKNKVEDNLTPKIENVGGQNETKDSNYIINNSTVLEEKKKEQTEGSQDSKFSCQTCNLDFESKTDLNVHLDSHITEEEKEEKRNCDLKIPVVVLPKEDKTCPQCSKIFSDNGDFAKHIEDHKIRKEKHSPSPIIEALPINQHTQGSKNTHGSDVRYVTHHLSPVSGYYPYNPYNGPNFYRPCVGYCDGGCHPSHLEPTTPREHDNHPVYYSPHGYYGHPHFKTSVQHGEQVYAFGAPNHFEDHHRLGRSHQEPHFHDTFNRGYNQQSKSSYSPDPRFYETLQPFEVPCGDEFPSKDQQIVQNIINANLLEESLVSDLYSCLSCTKCFQTRDELDEHTVQHASEPLEYVPNTEFPSHPAGRPHFHFPQSGYCNPGSDLYPHPVNHRVPQIGQPPPPTYPIIASALPHGPTFASPRFDLSPSSYQVPSVHSCHKVRNKGVGTESNDPEDSVGGVIVCCYCAARYTTKTDLWSHLMRRHGLKSRDARAKVADCSKQRLKPVSEKNCGITIKQQDPCKDLVGPNALHLPGKENSELVSRKPNSDDYSEAVDFETPQHRDVNYEKLTESLARKSETAEAFEVLMEAEITCDMVENEFSNPTHQVETGQGADGADNNVTSSEQNEGLFQSVCENVMALLNSPDSVKQFENDFLMEESDDGVCNSKQVQCKDCPLTFTSMRLFRIHIRLHHGELPYECQTCFQRFRNGLVLKQHKLLHTNLSDQVLYCKICDKDFSKLDNYRMHVTCHEDKVAASCETCGRSFLSPRALRQHQNFQLCASDVNCLLCKVCGMRCGTRKLLQTHVSRKHASGKYFHCSSCCKHFKHRNSLISHTREHLALRTRTCDRCQESFKSKADLRDHMSVYHECSCSICNRNFENLEVLERHRLFKHPSKPRSVSKWKKRESLRRISEKKFAKTMKTVKRQVCGKTFSSGVSLKNHSVMHNGVKPLNS